MIFIWLAPFLIVCYNMLTSDSPSYDQFVLFVLSLIVAFVGIGISVEKNNG